jgi:biotin carboxyl carrier protein
VYRLFHWGAGRRAGHERARRRPAGADAGQGCARHQQVPAFADARPADPIAVRVGQEVKAGEVLAKIEAMKMENVLKAERDCVVDKLLAQPGESLAVDQQIIAFK